MRITLEGFFEKTTEIEETSGLSLMQIFRKYGINYGFPCGGRGICGGCDVFVNDRLEAACRFVPSGDCVVRPADHDEELRILVPFSGGLSDTKTPAGEKAFGAAVDIGTTTIAAALVDISTGNIIKTASCINPGRDYGSDVISRIAAVSSGNERILQDELINAVYGCIEELINMGSDTDPRSDKKTDELKINGLAIAANSTMVHFFLRYPVKSLGEYPFRLYSNDHSGASCFGIPYTLIFPSVTAFVGGDIISGLYSLDLFNSVEPFIFIDLGTNAEMIIGNDGRLISASAAAGCVFDGVGVFGSGAVEAVYDFYQRGLIDENGVMRDEIISSNGLTDSRGKLFTPEAVADILTAKAAVRAGIEVLLKHAGLLPEELQRVCVAGGFGYYLDMDAAIGIGMMPAGFSGKCEPVGNTALLGCVRALKDGISFEELKEMAEKIEHVELANDADFTSRFLENMALPKKT